MPPAMEIDYVLSMNSDWKLAEVECVDPHGYDEAGDLLFERDAEVPFGQPIVIFVRDRLRRQPRIAQKLPKSV